MTSVDVGVFENGSGAVGNSLSKRLNPVTENYEWQGEAPNTKVRSTRHSNLRWSSAT